MKIEFQAEVEEHAGRRLTLGLLTLGDVSLLKRFLEKQKKRAGGEVYVALDAPPPRRTFRQNAAVWKLVSVIFESMEGRKPCEDEKHNLYLDLLDEYAEKTVNRVNGKTRPVHISESDVYNAALFIDGLIFHLCECCDLTAELQAEVRTVLHRWEKWRGLRPDDPLDYLPDGTLINEAEWRKKHIYSEASGKVGDIQLAHIVSRGADPAAVNYSWNWLALLPEEHLEQHQNGWDEFLKSHPHLKGKVERARRMARTSGG